MTPRFLPKAIIKAKLLGISVLSIFIPICIFFLLKNLKIISSVHLKTYTERKIPLMLYILIFMSIKNFVIQDISQTELYFYFSNWIYACLIALCLCYFKIKASLHLMGCSLLTGFVISASLLYQSSFYWLIGVCFVLTGLVATARLYLKAHTSNELLWGTLAGLAPYSFLFFYL